MLSPDGGETLVINDPRLLTWTATDNCAVVSVDLLLSRDGAVGPLDETIASGIANTSSYQWTVTGPETTHGILKVLARDEAGNPAEDLSDGEFDIIADCGICQVSYCASAGFRCVHDGTCGAGGCCNYSCAPDETCGAPDQCPPNACGC